MLPLVTTLVAIAIVVGICGIVVPVLPGSSLIIASIVGWAFAAQTSTAWWVMGVCVALFAAGWALQYVIPGKKMREVGVPNRTLIFGAIAGVIGMFVIPVAGFPLGFVAGVFAAESVRLQGAGRAWPSTITACKAALMSYGIELSAAVLMALTWAVGVKLVLF